MMENKESTNVVGLLNNDMVNSFTMENKESTNVCNLFNNDMVNAARNSLTKEQLDRYKSLGEEMYGVVDFDNCKLYDDSLNEAYLYVREQLKSGLHPSMMSENEKRIMEEMEGKECYTKWDYVKEDLNDIVTLRK